MGEDGFGLCSDDGEEMTDQNTLPRGLPDLYGPSLDCLLDTCANHSVTDGPHSPLSRCEIRNEFQQRGGLR